MPGMSRLPASATFGGLLLLAALAAPGSARADVTEVFNLFGEFDNGSTLSGTLTVDTTAGSATAIDAFADGFEFKTITGQSSGLEYTVNADTAGNAAQLSLVFGVHSLVGYGGSSLSPDTHLGASNLLQGGGANPIEVLACSRALDLGVVDRWLRWRWIVRRSPRPEIDSRPLAALFGGGARRPARQNRRLTGRPGPLSCARNCELWKVGEHRHAAKNLAPCLYEKQNRCYMCLN